MRQAFCNDKYLNVNQNSNLKEYAMENSNIVTDSIQNMYLKFKN
jgi:hypothetical protein